MRPRRRLGRWAAALLLLIAAAGASCLRWGAQPVWSGDETCEVLTTGYCNCGICCSWRLDEKGEPVVSAGSGKGRPKKVGVTFTGTTAHHGTIAADPKLFTFGTRIYVPGYGPGCVEDIGGAIRGRHLDLWFPTHEEARRWGCRRVTVRREQPITARRE